MYYPVPCDGSSSFIESHGDLNHNAGGEYIFLYYTKDFHETLGENTLGLTDIYFDEIQSGALSWGGSGYDLNDGTGASHEVYMHVTYTTGGNVVTLSSGTGTVEVLDGQILTGTGGADTKVIITIDHDEDDVIKVTLSGVNITAIANDADHNWSGITCMGNAIITLDEGTTNTVKGAYHRSGIIVPTYKTLTIQGSGTLNATGAPGAAGIGSGYDQSSCGNFNIKSGTINASGGNMAAGIGSGYNQSSCGDIYLRGGNITATGGIYGAGIGSGSHLSSCGYINIFGGTVTATGGLHAPGIGSGENQSSCDPIGISHYITYVTAIKGNQCEYAIGAGVNSTCMSVSLGGVETGFFTESPFITFPYFVAFDANGGTNTWGSTQPFLYNAAEPLLENISTCTGYTFDGWSTTLNGPKEYDDEGSVFNLTDTPSGTVTLYARWKALNTIAGYSTSGGWQLIASPMANAITPNEENGFITGTYDLYRFNQAADAEWENWKDAANLHFNLESGRGYLYANQEGTTLTFNGTPYTANGEITLSKTTGAQFEGCNLIGNPFGTSATINKAFYRMNPETHDEIILADNNTIAAMEGIFVIAANNNEIVTFTQQSSKADNDEEMVVINLSKGNTTIDRAIVRFDEGQTLPKFQLFENSTKIYIPQSGKDYAMVNAGNENEIPVNFKAKENGVYTLNVSAVLSSQLSAFSLIDNLTGADINLLTTPSYTFEAKTTDHANRFKLVFMENEDNLNNNDNFAYLSNGELIINGKGTLQVFDALGRQLFSKELSALSSQLSVSTFPTGVYVLRLVNEVGIRTQKVVFE